MVNPFPSGNNVGRAPTIGARPVRYTLETPAPDGVSDQRSSGAVQFTIKTCEPTIRMENMATLHSAHLFHMEEFRSADSTFSIFTIESYREWGRVFGYVSNRET